MQISAEIKTFLDEWKENENQTKKAFSELLEYLGTFEDTELGFNARPGVSYSLRPRRKDQKKRSLFAMVDVIDDDPDERWLSICFYGEMITDPDEMGDLIPEGLLGEDGYCFDMYSYDENEIAYVKERLAQAHDQAAESE